MIEDDHQLAVTLLWIKRFKQSINRLQSNPYNLDLPMNKLQIESIQSMLDELREEVEKYKAKKNG